MNKALWILNIREKSPINHILGGITRNLNMHYRADDVVE